MQKHQKPSPTRGSLRLIFIFCAVVFSVITFSLLFRLFFLIRESRVDRADAFTVSFVYKEMVDVVTVLRDEKKLSHLKITGKGTPGEKLLAVGLLPDTQLTLSTPFKGYEHTSSYFYDASFHKNGIATTLSFYDLLRLALAAKAISASSMATDSIKLPSDEHSSDVIVSRMLRDQSLLQDDKTITIINATGVVGLGTKVGRAFSNMGLSVVAVNNGEKPLKSSAITFYDSKSYTSSRLSSLLSIVPKESSKQGLSDIILTLGKDNITIYDKKN